MNPRQRSSEAAGGPGAPGTPAARPPEEVPQPGRGTEDPEAPLALQPPSKALLAAFRGDLPATLLAEQYERAAQYLATAGDTGGIRGDPHEDLLQVRTPAVSQTNAGRTCCM